MPSSSSPSGQPSSGSPSAGYGHLDRDAAERVLRRAVQLDDAPRDPSQRLSVSALLEAAADLGMDPSSVHRAVAEEQAGLLDPHTSALDRLAGPLAVSASRVVGTPLSETMRLVDEWLRRTWAFRRVRGSDTEVLYRRRTDPVAAIQRATRSVTGKENAEKVRQLRVTGHAVDPHRTLVAVVVDLHSSRTAVEVSGASVGGAGVVVSAASALASTPWMWLGVPASVAMGVGVMATRRAWTRGIDDELEGLLDKVAGGRPPDAVLGELTGRLLGDLARRGSAGGEAGRGSEHDRAAR